MGAAKEREWMGGVCGLRRGVLDDGAPEEGV